MPVPSIDRRSLLKLGGGLWAGALASASMSALAKAAAAQQQTGRFKNLDPQLATTLEAITARIIPTTDTPGAREAGAIWFIDAAVATDFADALPLLQAGVAELNAASDTNFARLSAQTQDERLRAIEDGEFFGLMHLLTVAGTFTMPRYGGNHGEAGWDLIGMQRSHHWQAPFGHYDAAVHNGKEGQA